MDQETAIYVFITINVSDRIVLYTLCVALHFCRRFVIWCLQLCIVFFFCTFFQMNPREVRRSRLRLLNFKTKKRYFRIIYDNKIKINSMKIRIRFLISADRLQ